MIEKIFIPTVKRSDNQITFENLPTELQSKVVMVIDPSERSKYSYPCEYLELPTNIIGSWTQLAQTRKFIHQTAGNIKYVMADDDLILYKRNSKYWSDTSDMEASKRVASKDEILRLFETASKWLDSETIGIVGLSDNKVPPANTEYSDTKGVFTFLFLDGKKISKIADQLETSVRVAEDLLFLFECLSVGIDTRMSNEFLYINKSESASFESSRPIWADMFKDKQPDDYFQTDEHYDALRYIQQKFPTGIEIFKEDGRMKNIKTWKKVLNCKKSDSLENFFND